MCKKNDHCGFCEIHIEDFWKKLDKVLLKYELLN